MALPKLNSPTYQLELPSTGKKIKYRPFLVKEQKILMMAQESKDEHEVLNAMTSLVNDCTFGKIDATNSPMFDVEYIFLRIRAKSVGEVSTLEYGHTDGVNYDGVKCDHITELKVNLEDIKAEKLEGHTDEVRISEQLYVKMKYPSLMELSALDFADQESTDEFKLVANCIDYVFDDNETYEADTEQEKISFVESMNTKQMTELGKFFDTMPRIRHEIPYTCEGCGQEDVLKLEGLSDFF